MFSYTTRRRCQRLLLRGIKYLFLVLARKRLVTLTALLLRYHFIPLDKERQGVSDYNVLILPKDGFIEDVLACLGNDAAFAIYSLEREIVKVIAAGFDLKNINNTTHRGDLTDLPANKQQYHDFMVKVWHKVMKEFPVHFALTGNFCYFAEQEFAGALSEVGTLFIALHKECLKSEASIPFFTDLYTKYRFPFKGDAILVYNAVEKQILADSGIIAPEKIFITGMPRLDSLHSWRQKNALAGGEKRRTKQVLFLSFGPKSSLPFVCRETSCDPEERHLGRLDWGETPRLCHEALVELARRNPDIQVLLKSKGSNNAVSLLRDYIPEDSTLPPNLKIIFGGDILPYLVASDVVCGFNSTAVLEALAAKKALVIPQFGDGESPELARFVIPLGESVDYAATPDELIRIIEARVSAVGPEIGDSALEGASITVLEKFAGNGDGKAGERVKNVLLELKLS